MITPSVPTRRTTWLNVSTMYIVPAPSKVSIRGSFIWASRACPPSPVYPGGLLPATVVIVPAPAPGRPYEDEPTEGEPGGDAPAAAPLVRSDHGMTAHCVPAGAGGGGPSGYP